MNKKQCTTCGEMLSFDNFHSAKLGKHGLKSKCKKCEKVRNREWREHNIEQCLEKSRVANARNGGWEAPPKDKYDLMVKMADGECVICGSDNNGKTLHTDHNHDTGQIRDLLCGPCNQTLGLMEEDPERFRAAADYLEDHLGQRAA